MNAMICKCGHTEDQHNSEEVCMVYPCMCHAFVGIGMPRTNELLLLRASHRARLDTLDWLKRTFDNDECVLVCDVVEHLKSSAGAQSSCGCV